MEGESSFPEDIIRLGKKKKVAESGTRQRTETLSAGGGERTPPGYYFLFIQTFLVIVKSYSQTVDRAGMASRDPDQKRKFVRAVYPVSAHGGSSRLSGLLPGHTTFIAADRATPSRSARGSFLTTIASYYSVFEIYSHD